MGVFEGSRYILSPLYQRGSTMLLEPREKANFNLDNATYYTVIEGDTIEGIAYRQYGNAQLYWAIMDANKQYMSELEIKPGDQLLIPAYSEVVKLIG